MVGDVANWTVTLDLQDAINSVKVRAWVNGTGGMMSEQVALILEGE